MAITTINDLKKEYPVLCTKIVAEALGEDTESFIQVKKNKSGEIIEWVEETRDLEGILISKRVDTFSFYDSKEVDTINQKVFNESDVLVSENRVNHFNDGSQPIIRKAMDKCKEVVAKS